MLEYFIKATKVLPLTKWIKKYTWLFVFVGLISLFVIQAFSSKFNFKEYDWLLLSGTFAYLLAIYRARQVPKKILVLLKRLVSRGTLVANSEQINKVEQRIQQTSTMWGLIAAIISSASILVSFLYLYRFDNLELTVLQSVGGSIGGWCLGRMSAYGTLALALKKEKIEIRVSPGHIDRVCGLKPIGDFYLFQAFVAVIPASFLAFWLYIILFFETNYDGWSRPYFWLLTLALVFIILIVLVPLYLFHLEMADQKNLHLCKADKLSFDILSMQEQLLYEDSRESRDKIKDNIEILREAHNLIECMVTWPIHPKSLRNFTIQNIVLMIPIFREVTGDSKYWGLINQLLENLY